LDDDVPNNTVEDTDGIAVINDYLIDGPTQEIYFSPVNPDPDDRFNVHPAFFITYTPDCDFLPDLSDIPRTYSFCRGESIELEAAEGYDHYSWSTSLGTSDGLNDSTLANPICSADTSLWYTVRMWNEDEEGCSQTIPVFVEVNTVPAPEAIEIAPSVCPPATGEIAIINPAGPGSFTYSIDGVVQLSPVFDELAAGSYEIAVNSAQGCLWDSTITVPLNPTQEADFSPNPSSGFSPLEVFFDNRSTGASDYLWLIDGEEISSSENLLYNFPDSGSFEISLIAFLNEESCADTATFTLRVDQGIEVMLPNIITPNGDGRNDKLVAMLKGVETCQWLIYNRWGVEVNRGVSAPLDDRNSVNDSGFAELQLWSPQAETPDGVYTVVFQATGVKGQSEEMVFSLTVGR
jgi:PKD repeat protein